MKNGRISLIIATLIVAAFHFAPIPPNAFGADAQTANAAVALLTSGQWKISAKDRSDVRVFMKDGTFTTPGKPGESGQWTMSKDFVILILPSGHKDALTLPLNAKGTEGYADNGDALTAVQLKSVAANTAQTTPAATGPEPASTPQAGAISARDKDAAVALLTSGQWRISGGNWFKIRTFNKDGTFTTQGNPKGHGVWSIEKDMVVVTFADGHKDTLSLPLNAKGSEGVSDDGTVLTAVLLNGNPANTAPAAASQVAPLTAQQKAATVSMLVSGPWKFIGSWWFAVRNFDQDGTFTTVAHPSEIGSWKISNNSIVLTFADGHADTLNLPLNPRGTEGFDKDGALVTAVRGNPPAPKGTPVQSDMDAFFHPTPTPHVMTAQEKAASMALLVSAPWKIIGSGWTEIRRFAKDGTFTTAEKPNASGAWIITNNTIELTFQDGHIDTLALPLDPKGADGADQHGAPTIAVLQDAAAAGNGTPAPDTANTRPAQGATPAPFGNQQPPAPTPAKGHTPAPFGTSNPG